MRIYVYCFVVVVVVVCVCVCLYVSVCVRVCACVQDREGSRVFASGALVVAQTAVYPTSYSV